MATTTPPRSSPPPSRSGLNVQPPPHPHAQMMSPGGAFLPPMPHSPPPVTPTSNRGGGRRGRGMATPPPPVLPPPPLMPLPPPPPHMPMMPMPAPGAASLPPPGPTGEDPWPDWFPFVPHAPVLGEKKPWRSRPELLRRLERDGIIVAKGIIDPHECAELLEDMSVWLKRHGVDTRDNRTWSRTFTPEHFHMSESIPGMMNDGPPCFSSVALKARSSPKVCEIFRILYDLPSEQDLVMQLQGLFWGFAPEKYPEGYIPHAGNGGFYHWSSMWMHSDRGRSTVWPPKLQCTLVLEDVGLYDHGFVFLSKSHYYHDEFFQQHPQGSLELEEMSQRERDNYIQLTYENVKYFEQRGCQWKKVVVPKGSIIIWDSRLIHSTSLPNRGRPQAKTRFIVFGGYVPRAFVSDEEREERIKLFQQHCHGIDRQVVLELWQRGPVGRLRRLMGLDEQMVPTPALLGLPPNALDGLPQLQQAQSQSPPQHEQEKQKEGAGNGSGSGSGSSGGAAASSSSSSSAASSTGEPTPAKEEGEGAAGGAAGAINLPEGEGEQDGGGGEEEGKKATIAPPLVQVKGVDGAWSSKEKEAANALMGILRL